MDKLDKNSLENFLSLATTELGLERERISHVVIEKFTRSKNIVEFRYLTCHYRLVVSNKCETLITCNENTMTLTLVIVNLSNHLQYCNHLRTSK